MITYLFDFDGTLVDSMPSWSSVMKRILDEFNVKYPVDLVSIITPLGIAKTADYYIELGVPLSANEIVELMGKHMLDEYYYRIPAKENVVNVLKTLKNNGHSLNVLTASPHITLNACLKRLGIWDLFSKVWSCDDFNTNKADPEIYRSVAKKLNLFPEEIIFFDDNCNACKTAKAAGMKVCGVYDDTSKNFVDDIKRVTDFYIYDFKELLDLNL